jgi:hypothetical protein
MQQRSRHLDEQARARCAERDLTEARERLAHRVPRGGPRREGEHRWRGRGAEREHASEDQARGRRAGCCGDSIEGPRPRRAPLRRVRREVFFRESLAHVRSKSRSASRTAS